MSGRPINQDRQNALELGLMTYTGAVHKNCGTTERYVKGGGCVHCGRLIATEQREARVYLRRQAMLDSEPGTGVETEAQAEARRQAAIDELM